MLPVLLESVSKQTVMPDETILVLSQDETDVNGTTLMRFNFPGINVDAAPQRRDAHLDTSFLENQSPQVIGASIRANSQPLELSVLRIPNLRVLIRTGTYLAGHNRMYGVDHSKNETEVFFFFDCDDYMHHQRTEHLARIFSENSDLDAMIHEYEGLRLAEWYSTETVHKFQEDIPFPTGPNVFRWTYQEMRDSMPFDKFVKDPNGEPSQTGDDVWFFPHMMRLPHRDGIPLWGANGWVTFRKRVLDTVKYPVERPVGEDSIFNYRILRAGLNWNYLPLTLGLYLRAF